MTIVNNAAFEIPSFYIGVLEANVDMSVESTWQYAGVAVGAASGAGLLGPAALVAPASSGAAILGVLQNNPQLAEAGSVMCLGVSKVLCGGTFAIGAQLSVNAAGAFIAAASGNVICGVALRAGAAGTISSAYLTQMGVHA